jgi:hypothetical protein
MKWNTKFDKKTEVASSAGPVSGGGVFLELEKRLLLVYLVCIQRMWLGPYTIKPIHILGTLWYLFDPTQAF